MSRIFGPVPSRRLGLSLGIDIVPYKTCSFDCVYCECGATTEKTVERREFYPLEDLLGELEGHLAGLAGRPEVLTLSGAGEPTLYSRMGELIREAKRISGIPVAVITNSSLLHLPGLRNELLEADIVLPSLDAATHEVFRSINRPHPSCDLELIIDGLARFTDVFRGTTHLEILLAEGYNTGTAEIDALRAVTGALKVNTIQLNTAVRPGTETCIAPLDRDGMTALCERFGPRCETIDEAGGTSAGHDNAVVDDRILAMLRRRPCTADDIRRSLGIPAQELVKWIAFLESSGEIRAGEHDGKVFYTAMSRDS